MSTTLCKANLDSILKSRQMLKFKCRPFDGTANKKSFTFSPDHSLAYIYIHIYTQLFNTQLYSNETSTVE